MKPDHQSAEAKRLLAKMEAGEPDSCDTPRPASSLFLQSH
jgi:hypothetical protein